MDFKAWGNKSATEWSPLQVPSDRRLLFIQSPLPDSNQMREQIPSARGKKSATEWSPLQVPSDRRLLFIQSPLPDSNR